MLAKREFTVAGEYHYHRSSAPRWIFSHFLRYKYRVLFFLLLAVLVNLLYASVITLTGNAFTAIQHQSFSELTHLVIVLLIIIFVAACTDMGARLSAEILGKSFARDARDELYLSLLGKSQTFHNRQRVGDVMARASNDMTTLSDMVVPGFDIVFDSFTSLITVLIFIGLLNVQLLLVPLLFTIAFLITLRRYSRLLSPISNQMRAQFGTTNAILTEAVNGIEVIKATAQEEQEKQKFEVSSGKYRDFYVQNGRIQGSYLPTLLLGIALALAFLHGLYLLSQHQLSIGGLVSFMGLMTNLRFVSFMSIWSFSLVQLGVSGAKRILNLMSEESELDENDGGYTQEMRGAITFEQVTFAYGDTPVLRDVSFHAQPGQTIAIVGQTGSGKSTLTKLVNRIYDVNAGRVLIDEVNVRDWSLDALRSQISTIEQDVFLFSRTIAENIAYGLGRKADRAAIEQAAKDAQAHDFIMGFKDGYDTVIGERGVTLSGGQRQRIAIARALLTDPHILILDDSTSAIDSATEDEIQKAIHRLLEGRTTLLITHRLSQIRWADKVLVLRNGELIDQGGHQELLARCEIYRRIFSHYESASPAVSVGGE
ncbi:MAG TPA: ABC transporter ATP-binding protein [Ktedonobacteraceae bacterium]|nr:ABC transporter ATP-binding protein [Ktedonobacteraceae bacterium]